MQVAKPFDMTQPAVSRHLRVLEHAGLITRRVEGTKRPCRVQESGIQAVEQWLATLRDALSRNYDRLDKVLMDMQPRGKRRRSADEPDNPDHRR